MVRMTSKLWREHVEGLSRSNSDGEQRGGGILGGSGQEAFCVGHVQSEVPTRNSNEDVTDGRI